MEIREDPVRGIGLYVTEDVSAGTMLAAETVLAIAHDVSLTHNPDLKKMADELTGDLIFSSSKKALGLSAMLRAEWDDDSFRQKLLQLDPGPGWAREELSGKNWDQDEGKRLFLAAAHNCFESPLNYGGKAKQEASLYFLLSIPKHSCTPNSIQQGFGRIGILRAIRDLKKGEEVLLDYVALWAHPQTRMTNLMKYWGFSCCCPLCSKYFDEPSVL